jgi:threonine synthase
MWTPLSRLSLARVRVERGVILRHESIVICLTGSGLKTPDALRDRLQTQVTIRPSLSAFDEARANIKSQSS